MCMCPQRPDESVLAQAGAGGSVEDSWGGPRDPLSPSPRGDINSPIFLDLPIALWAWFLCFCETGDQISKKTAEAGLGAEGGGGAGAGAEGGRGGGRSGLGVGREGGGSGVVVVLFNRYRAAILQDENIYKDGCLM